MKKSPKNLNARRSLRFETLEDRHLLAVTLAEGSWYQTVDFNNDGYNDFDVTSDVQELLEWINEMRVDPETTFKRIFSTEYEDWIADEKKLFANDNFVQLAVSNYDYPKDSLQDFLDQWKALVDSDSDLAPLAFGAGLINVAKVHNDYMLGQNTDISELIYFHTGEDLGENQEESLESIMEKLQYSSYGENVDAVSNYIYNTYYYNSQVCSTSLSSFFHAAFAVDWDNPDHKHRDNIMSQSFTEVGIAISSMPNPLLLNGTKSFVTEEFGGVETAGGAWLLGILGSDFNMNGLIENGEGISNNVSIVVTKLAQDGSLTNDSVTVSPFSSGGYQVFLANGLYRVTVSSGNLSNSMTKVLSIDGKNVKLDFDIADYSNVLPDMTVREEVTYREDNVQHYIYVADNLKLANSNQFYEAVVKLTGRPDQSNESLSIGTIENPNIKTKYSFNESDGSYTLYIYGEGSLTDYQSLLRSVQYINYSEQCTVDVDRTITVTISNGFNSVSREITVHVDPSPVELSIGDQAVYEGDDGVTYMTFTASLSQAQRKEVSFIYAVENISNNDEQYVFGTGKVVFVFDEKTGKSATEATFEIAITGNYDAQVDDIANGSAILIYDPDRNVTFNIAVSEIAGGADLVTSNITGTIIDDDTPLAITSSATNPPNFSAEQIFNNGVFQTEYGLGRLVYAYTAETVGLVQWNVTSGLAKGTTLAVYENAYSNMPIAVAKVSDDSENGVQTLQWTADRNVTYIVVIEKGTAESVTALSATLLEMNTDNFVLIDPILDLDDGEAKAILFDFNGDSIAFSDGSSQWSFDRESRFIFDDQAGFALRFPYDTADIMNANGIESKQVKVDVTKSNGKYSLAFAGENLQEEVVFYGTIGKDVLNYKNGSGTFMTNVGSKTEKIWTFTNLATVSFVCKPDDSDDTATIVDSLFDDSYTVDETELTLTGGGHRLTVQNFNSINAACTEGSNSIRLATQLAETDILVLPAALVVSGTKDNNSFNYILRNFNRADIAPETKLNSLTLVADGEKTSKYYSAFGQLKYESPSRDVYLALNNVKELVFIGFYDPNNSSLNINLTGAVNKETNESTVSFADKDEQKIVLPIAWSEKFTSVAESDVSQEIRTAALIDLEKNDLGDDSSGLQPVAIKSATSLAFVLEDFFDLETQKKNRIFDI